MAGGCEAEQHRRRLAAFVRTDKQPIVATDRDPLHLALGCIVVDGKEKVSGTFFS